MIGFNRNGRTAEDKDAAKTALKPALYAPPTSATALPPGNPLRGSPAAPPGAPHAPAPTRDGNPTPPAGAAGDTRAHAGVGESSQSKLSVGINIRLKGVEISNCDALFIEGQVEATVNSKAMEIAKPGALKGTATIDVAEIHGEFSGELTARTRLVVHGTGRVQGTIRYGKLIVEEGGELRGDVNRLDETPETAVAPRHEAVETRRGSPAFGNPLGTH